MATLDPATCTSDLTGAASQVNQVISADTRGHISKLVTPGMLTHVGWVLTSALYLDAKWAAPFDPNNGAYYCGAIAVKLPAGFPQPATLGSVGKSMADVK